MKNRKAYFGLALILVSLGFFGCGDQNDSRLSDADVAYIKQQQLAATYGTAYSTSVVTVTAVSTQTVTASTTTVY